MTGRQKRQPATPDPVPGSQAGDAEAEAVAAVEALAARMEAQAVQAERGLQHKPRYRDRYAGPLVADAYRKCAAMVRDLLDDGASAGGE